MENNYHDQSDYLQFEKELKQLKEIAECNALDLFYTIKNKFKGKSEFEAQFMASMYMLENAHKLAGQVTIYEFIGMPSFIPVDNLKDVEIGFQLEYLLDALERNQIVLEYPEEADEREVYRFITDEFFEEEIDNVRIPGYTFCFNYEEYYPNPVEAIEYSSESFLWEIFNQASDGGELCLFVSASYRYQDKIISEGELLEKIEGFHCLFSTLNSKQIDIKNIHHNEGIAVVECEVSYEFSLRKEKEILSAITSGKLELKLENGSWKVCQALINGILQ